MKTSDETQKVENETKRLLDEVLRDVVKSPNVERTGTGDQRQRQFAIGLLLIAPFCLVATLLFWVQKDQLNSAIWFIFSVVLLWAGGWQFDKSNPPTDDCFSRDKAGLSNGLTKKCRIRRVK